MKRILFAVILIAMFNFKTTANANYKQTFFDFSIKSNTGKNINLNQYKNNVILIVNTASYCGFTKQYDDLQKIWDQYKSKGLIVLGVPSNSFGQEKENSNEIKDFCEVNFNISFPMTSIYEVKGNNAHEIYKWAEKNYGKSTIPKWNFHKILINKEGKIEETFSSLTKPTSNKITNILDKLLN